MDLHKSVREIEGLVNSQPRNMMDVNQAIHYFNLQPMIKTKVLEFEEDCQALAERAEKAGLDRDPFDCLAVAVRYWEPYRVADCLFEAAKLVRRLPPLDPPSPPPGGTGKDDELKALEALVDEFDKDKKRGLQASNWVPTAELSEEIHVSETTLRQQRSKNRGEAFHPLEVKSNQHLAGVDQFGRSWVFYRNATYYLRRTLGEK